MNLTKTKQKIAQHEPHQNKTEDCPTRTPPKQNKIAQHEPHQNKTKDCPTRTPPKQNKIAQHELHQNNKRLPNTNPTKTKQKIAQQCKTIIYRQPLSMGYLIPRLVISLSRKQK